MLPLDFLLTVTLRSNGSKQNSLNLVSVIILWILKIVSGIMMFLYRFSFHFYLKYITLTHKTQDTHCFNIFDDMSIIKKFLLNILYCIQMHWKLCCIYLYGISVLAFTISSTHSIIVLFEFLVNTYATNSATKCQRMSPKKLKTKIFVISNATIESNTCQYYYSF